MTSNKNLVFGLHSVAALLQNQPERIIRLYVMKERQDKRLEGLIRSADEKSILIERVSHHELDRMVDSASHQGVVALCAKAHIYSEKDLGEILQRTETPPLLLVLDGVQDPHNLGACFRSADAAGAHAIIAPKDRSVGLTPVVSKVASGAAETLPFIQVVNLVRALEQLKELGVWIFGAAAEATETLYQTDFKGPVALVLGAEGKGLRRLTREHCDGLIKIPMYGSVSSLNVSVAAGVFLFEVVRQRNS